MRFELITDSTDALVGMRLAGISGVMAHTAQEVEIAISDIIKKEDVAIILISETLVDLCKDLVYEIKSTCKRPLIVEIPGSETGKCKNNNLTKYIHEAIGIDIN